MWSRPVPTPSTKAANPANRRAIPRPAKTEPAAAAEVKAPEAAAAEAPETAAARVQSGLKAAIPPPAAPVPARVPVPAPVPAARIRKRTADKAHICKTALARVRTVSPQRATGSFRNAPENGQKSRAKASAPRAHFRGSAECSARVFARGNRDNGRTLGVRKYAFAGWRKKFPRKLTQSCNQRRLHTEQFRAGVFSRRLTGSIAETLSGNPASRAFNLERLTVENTQ